MAGTYVKLQDAYAAERNAAGGWKLIGYTKPASNNFNYTGSVTEDGTVELDKLNANMGWRAENTVALNDCQANKCFWNITLDKGSAGGQIEYAACQSSDAAPLTANFTAIGTPNKTCTAK